MGHTDGGTPLFDWPRVYGLPGGTPVGPGNYRETPEGFEVEEMLGFAPEGAGEHLWLWLEKTGQTTPELVKRLARVFDVAPRDIGVSGLKDRNAVTRQWVSLWLPGQATPDDIAERISEAGARLIEHARHSRKLKRGVHRGNRFRLWVSFDESLRDAFTARWQAIIAGGVPNYFGPQRFGRDGGNVVRARQLFARGWRKRDDKQGLMLSAARSFLFNEILAQRIRSGCWNAALPGEVFNLDGTASRFAVDDIDDVLRERLGRLDIHPTGALWGRGRLESQGEVAVLEQAIAAEHDAIAAGLESAGLRQERRALRIRLDTPTIDLAAGGAWLGFTLGRGAFATAVLRELIDHPTL